MNHYYNTHCTLMSFTLEYTIELSNSNRVECTNSKKKHTCEYSSAKSLINDLMKKNVGRSTSPGGWTTFIYEQKKPIKVTLPDGKILSWAKFIREFA